MTDDLHALRADIAFLRGLAEDGREAPARQGGAFLAAAGGIFGAACVVHWLFQTGWLPTSAALGEWIYALVWLAASALFIVARGLLRRRLGVQSGSGRASAAAWAGVGWTIFALAGSIAILSWRLHTPLPTLMFPSIILALYGLAWMVAAVASGRRWMWWVSIAAYQSAIVIAWFAPTTAAMLLLAAALVGLALLPGLALMRRGGRP